MQKSPIQWTTYTSNPFRARHKATGKLGWQCEIKSTGCINCYSGVLNHRLGTGTAFVPSGTKDVELFVNEKELWALLNSKKSGLVFPCDMTDIMWEAYPDEWLDRFFAVVAVCSNFTFQVLTKRAERLPEYFTRSAAARWADIIERDYLPKLSPCVGHVMDELRSGELWPLPNLWLGVSCEDQERADNRIPHLLNTPAAIRFVSAEPLIGPIDLTGEYLALQTGRYPFPMLEREHRTTIVDLLDWVIVGGESGPNARVCDADWIRGLVRQCRRAKVPVFVKQFGARAKDERNGIAGRTLKVSGDPAGLISRRLKDSHGGDWDEWSEDLRVRQFPKAYVEVAT